MAITVRAILLGRFVMAENITQNRQEGNAPFVAIPWAETLRLETNAYNPANWLRLYPVIATFQGINGCFLSQDKLAAYAGMSKEDIKPTLLNLLERRWLNEEKYNGRKTYKITTQYVSGNAQSFYMIGSELIKNGVWGALGQTRQVIYSILQAFAKSPRFIDEYVCFGGDEEDRKSFLNENEIDGHALKNCSYLPLSKYNPEMIMLSIEHCRWPISTKTFQRGIGDFQKYGLMVYFEYEAVKGMVEGFAFPRNPGLKVDGFDEWLKRIEDAQKEHKISYAAKRAAIAAKKRNQVNKGNSKFVKI